MIPALSDRKNAVVALRDQYEAKIKLMEGELFNHDLFRGFIAFNIKCNNKRLSKTKKVRGSAFAAGAFSDDGGLQDVSSELKMEGRVRVGEAREENLKAIKNKVDKNTRDAISQAEQLQKIGAEKDKKNARLSMLSNAFNIGGQLYSVSGNGASKTDVGAAQQTFGPSNSTDETNSGILQQLNIIYFNSLPHNVVPIPPPPEDLEQGIPYPELRTGFDN